MKHFSLISLATGIVISIVTAAIAAPPYTPSQLTPKVVIETVAGDITIELFPSKAPITVDNFLQYVNSGFYDGLIIHRVTKDATFKVVQGGGYLPGGVLKTEGLQSNITNESNNGLSNLRGTVAMARQTDPNSANSQFYINVTSNTSLDYQSASNPGYCVFGQVISGMDVVDQIQQLPLKTPAEAGGQMECPSFDDGWVIVYRQQVRVFVSTTGSDILNIGTVDSPFKTIQKGIDIISAPGHVVAAPGTYTGSGNRDLDFKGKAITVRAMMPQRGNVPTPTRSIIDCQGSSTSKHRAFYFHNGEREDSVLQGFTIINGYHDRGGAIWCQSDPTIKNCTFANNAAGYYGGGVYCYNSNAAIINCTFSGNNGPLRGGGLYVGYNSNVAMLNSILWNNTSAAGHEIAVSIVTPPSSLMVSYSDIEGGQAEMFIETGSSVEQGPGNLDVDPCFVNPANNDYHLQSQGGEWRDNASMTGPGYVQGTHTSPCLDSGNPGQPLGDEPAGFPANIRVDMGSFGGTNQANIPPAGWRLLADIDNDGTTNNVDFAWLGKFWKVSASELPVDLDRNGSVDIADLALFCNDWLK